MNTSGCIHDGWLVLSPRNQNVSPDFFYHLLGSDFVYAEFVRRAAGATVKNLNIDLVKGVQVPLPPMPEQRRIADLLDRAEALRAKRRAALGQLDALTQSIFLDLFGDPATNPKGWPLAHVGDVADVQGGLQVSSARKNHPCEIPYLRVANVFRGFLDLSEIKTLRATEAEISRTKLEKDDLLIVEGHGNPAEIGRGALWDGSVVGCIHQNHIIRVRFKRAQVLPLFACSYLNSPGGRRHLLRAGKTTSGLNTISVSEVL
jgi:type I restriction enzyme S subunit